MLVLLIFHLKIASFHWLRMNDFTKVVMSTFILFLCKLATQTKKIIFALLYFPINPTYLFIFVLILLIVCFN